MKLISTHTPREGRDLRFATTHIVVDYFNSHAPRGARPYTISLVPCVEIISTHTPREGRDAADKGTEPKAEISTHTPREGRDMNIVLVIEVDDISTHTPREGRDFGILKTDPSLLHFNSHAPRGARPM